MKKLTVLFMLSILVLGLMAGCAVNIQNKVQEVMHAGHAELPVTQETVLSQDDAKIIALTHAGYPEAETGFFRMASDFDDGRMKYEIDFVANGYEYEYEIDAETGSILSYDLERWD